MKFRLTALVIGLLLWPAMTQAGPSAVQPLFGANNIVVLLEDRLIPFNPELNLQGGMIDLQPQPDFEPQPDFLYLVNGHALIGQGNFLREFDENGIEVRSVDLTEKINGLELGPNGEIIVMTDDDIILWNLDADQKAATFDVADGTVPCLMPNDVLLFAVGATIQSLDLKSEQILEMVDSPNDQPVQGLAGRADGIHAVIAGNTLWLFDSELEKMLAGPVAVAGSEPQPHFLPNGDLLVVGDDTLTQLDGETLAFVQQIGLVFGVNALGAAVVPHLFEADVEGFLAEADGTVTDIKATALVSWTPGSGRTTLQMGSPEVAKTLGDLIVFHGPEADDFGAKGQRLVMGTQSMRTLGSYGADAFGFIGANDFYFADDFDAQIQAGRGADVLVGLAKSKTLLNGNILPID